MKWNQHMTPADFAAAVQPLLGADLVALILYGSAAAGDHAGRASDYNLLLVATAWPGARLAAIGPLLRRWQRTGSPAPLLFTRRELEQAADVFPLELLDMQDSHQILAGEDLLADLRISPRHLRHQVEAELRGLLLHLRQGFAVNQAAPRAQSQLLRASASSLLVLLRGALRLFDTAVPARKMDALLTLAQRLEFDPAPLLRIAELKTQRRSLPAAQGAALFSACLALIETVLQAVDAAET
ncbi:MAG: hypothetical protein K9N49_03650 [Candidatus Marinimicrobia bacterium]|nr:hypothetical protein [Candidatus Neomarinimicrobiota bacterium]